MEKIIKLRDEKIKEKETRKLQRINGANDLFSEIKLANTLF